MKTDTDLLDLSRELQYRIEATTSAADRKGRGQFFTPQSVCRFMAGLFSRPREEFRLLDPGAGVGALTAAVCEVFCHLKSPRQLEVHLFENDPRLIDGLARNMAHCRHRMEEAGHSLKHYIHVEDFVLAASAGFCRQRSLCCEEDRLGQFDGIITNPPYYKIRKDSLHARMMRDVLHGQPNIYALFLALAANLLRPGGELVAITPRSFCNGLYFRCFRKWFFQRMSLEHIHLFESRTDTFGGAGVLQESMISLTRRSPQQSPTVTVSTSVGPEFPATLDAHTMPAALVIDNSNGDHAIRIPTDADEQAIIKIVESLPNRFTATGLQISTGPVVMFRAEEYLLTDAKADDAVPLLLPQNVKPFKTVWPVKKNGKPIAFRVCQASRGLVLPTQNYVLLKRFTAKEEPRRLVAGCLLRAQQKTCVIAIENHLNYVHHERRQLTEEEVYGIAAVFNSRLFDRYFRMISGNTQVNATEVRAMRFPSLVAVANIGRRIGRASRVGPKEVEEAVLDELRVTSSVRSMVRECLE